MKKQAILRIRFIAAAIILVALVLLGRLYDIQIRKGDTYRQRAEEQYVHTVTNLFDRGSIYFTPREGAPFEAARIVPGYMLAINPQHIENPEETYDALAPYIEMDRGSFLTHAQKSDRTYREIEPHISSTDANAIDTLDLPGVELYRTQWRGYPGGTLAARTLGFIGYRGDELRGSYGLERYYDDVLIRDDAALSVNFFAELFGDLSNLADHDEDTKRAGDVVTAIEPTVAGRLDETLATIQEQWGSELTGGVIINPQTGSVYALSAVPTFNLGDRRGIPLTDFGNPIVEGVYEMGSIIKPLTMAAGIDAGAVTPETTYYDSGTLTLDGKTIGNYDGRGRGTVSMQEVLSQSLNTGVAYVVSQMGSDRFREYFKQLRIGSETGIDLPSEAHGLINNLNSPRDIEYATASFGQGIAMTPIATVRALSTLANGGVLPNPHIATEIRYEHGDTHEIGFPEGERVFKEETSEAVTRMLVTVVDDALAGGTVALPRHAIAAKTGTAQMAAPEGGYYENRYLHSFFGYFPAYDPKFLIFLYTVDPKEVRYASETLTEPFMDLAQFLINYYDIPPDR